MLRFYMWTVLGASCSVLFLLNNLLLQGLMQGSMLFALNLRFSLNLIEGRVFQISVFLETLLAGASALLYLFSPVYLAIFWIYFCSINKFGIESRERAGAYGKLSLFLGYLSSVILLLSSEYYHNDNLAGYGFIGILLNMLLLCTIYSCKDQNGTRDLEKASIAFCIGSGIVLSRFFGSRICLVPTLVVALGWLVVDMIIYVRNMRGVS